MIERQQQQSIEKLLGSRKAIIILGARQVGKSTLLNQLFDQREGVMWLNGDDWDVRQLLADMTSTRIKALIGANHWVVIDEAQRIPDIGLRLKLITDQVPGVQVVATGSSSFQLASQVNEPLTGRKREFHIFPLTYQEMTAHTNLLEEHRMIPHRMVYGYYPEVVTSPGEEQTVLRELSNSYLYKDILSLDSISKPNKLTMLLQALARQIGEQVSYNEVGQLIGLSPKTVERYIDVLEKSFIIFRLGSFSRNLRNELKASRKIYFWDLGIRNAVIANFQQVENRLDTGALWENFVIAERMKMLNTQERFCNSWFWRTQQQQEIDLVEEENGALRAFEFKWNPKKGKANIPASFAKAYPHATYTIVTPDNVDDFLLPITT
ncbi:putative ATPase (AAA+ superfamily) [Prevotella dentalis DSM 3688]|uniref:ATPase n=1 Tax=Prevotella dentalis (strain ATCC 49559 / DSM 3688 / JCM 13448 / NCTC 12043 / ES 2772) TaxID=908937 RepID=F9D380_PREDD|nr:ATP-binding protein [Prevotella dentalis]AGB28746.1 putative ATPase (AAA+ superfamily) [Prevotella dentalis DSM 3688]EGQ14631.1 ATPase [Prevotella dentalis DSM 3688]